MSKKDNTDKAMAETIKQKILKRLGTPPNLFKIECKNVYFNKWRVNIWVTKPSQGIAHNHVLEHSFFCTVTDNGTCKSKPKIERLYSNKTKKGKG